MCVCALKGVLFGFFFFPCFGFLFIQLSTQGLVLCGEMGECEESSRHGGDEGVVS